MSETKGRWALWSAALWSAWIIGIVALAAFAFWTLEFHASQSQTNAHYTLSTSTVSDPNGAILAEQGIVIQTVETDIPLLDETLAQEVSSRFQQVLPAGKVTRDKESAGQPILWIEINERDIQWMPFRADASLIVDVVYASDGDLSWRYDTGIVMSGDQPTVHSRGTLTLSDRTSGVISRKAYQRRLGEQIAAEIYRMMQQPLFDPPGS